jgi:hypothetical protein
MASAITRRCDGPAISFHGGPGFPGWKDQVPSLEKRFSLLEKEISLAGYEPLSGWVLRT